SLQTGLNNITVTARDGAGNTASATLAITYGTVNAPIIAIIAPTSMASYVTTSGSITLAGGASAKAGVHQVTWANERGGSGTASGTVSWSAKDIALQPGINRVTVNVWDNSGNSSAASIEITYNAADAISPTLSITSPGSAGSYSTTADIINVSGWASDNVGVTQVSWSNDRGGNGVASGTSTWSSRIALKSGLNDITITGRDAAGNVTSAMLTVIRTGADAIKPLPVTSPVAGGADSSR